LKTLICNMFDKSRLREKIKIFTIGHSNRPLDELLSLLGEFKIEVLVDIRRFPGSRKFPHFNRQSLEKTLPEAGIEYIWLEDLGGRRSGPDLADSPNTGLKSPAFRRYADYMRTEQFHSAVNRLLSVASVKPTAVMCAEKLFWKCHRRLLSDYLVARDVLVEHIMDSARGEHGLNSRLWPHKLSNGAAVTPDLKVIYSSSGSDVSHLFKR
jgi:uncharacterized protein (DUF488 family)